MGNTRAKPADTEPVEEQIAVTDGRMPGWYWVDNSVNIDYASRVKATGLAVYTALVLLARGRPEFHESLTTIASLAGLDSREAVIAALQRLDDNKLIAVFRKEGRASSYRILNVGVPDPSIPRVSRPSARPRPVGKTDRLDLDQSVKPTGEPVGKTDRLDIDQSVKPTGFAPTSRLNRPHQSVKPTLHRLDNIDTHHRSNTPIHNDDDARSGTRRVRFSTWEELRECYGEDGVATAQRLASDQAKRDDLGYIAGVCARRAAQGSPRPAAVARLAPEVAAEMFQARPAAAPVVLRGDPAWAQVVRGLDMTCGGDSRLASSFAEIAGDVLTVTLSGLAPEVVAGRVAWLQSRLARRIAEEWDRVTGARPAAVVVKGE